MTQQEIALAIAERVRAKRAQAGVSRKRLAALADVSERYLNELEKGGANVSLGILVRVADALGVAFTTLLPDGEARPTARGVGAPRPIEPGLADVLDRMTAAEQRWAATLLDAQLKDRRRRLKGIALLGLRGAGKTTIGRLLAERHRLPFVSITREIEARAGMSLADLFNLGGPDAYRALENEVACDLARREGRMVLETAGGIVGNEVALETILDAFVTVWVKATPQEHLARVIGQGDTRPTQGNPRALEHLKQLLATRESEYARAQHVLDTSGSTPDQCAAALEAIASPTSALPRSRRSQARCSG